MVDVASLRNEYTRAGLHERDVSPDPFAQFDRWFNEADRKSTRLNSSHVD